MRDWACPSCGSVDLSGEPAIKQGAAPTRRLLVICIGCGRELGELHVSEADTSRRGEDACHPYLQVSVTPVHHDVCRS
jgi:DNA-directed RNA polymerase subunit RPC12/RpoP